MNFLNYYSTRNKIGLLIALLGIIIVFLSIAFLIYVNGWLGVDIGSIFIIVGLILGAYGSKLISDIFKELADRM